MSKELTIDPEFKSLIPPLSAAELSQLEENILSAKKCRDALITWRGILIDGHNRYQICQKHEIDYITQELEIELNSREDVMLGIINNQFGRRNLTRRQLEYCRGKQYEAEKQIVTNKYGKNQHSKDEGQNDPQPKEIKEIKEREMFTAQRLALQHKTSDSTIKRDGKLANAIDIIGEVSPEARDKILSDEAKISKQDLIKLSNSPKGKSKPLLKKL
jgi:hypothetical protein